MLYKGLHLSKKEIDEMPKDRVEAFLIMEQTYTEKLIKILSKIIGR